MSDYDTGFNGSWCKKCLFLQLINVSSHFVFNYSVKRVKRVLNAFLRHYVQDLFCDQLLLFHCVFVCGRARPRAPSCVCVCVCVLQVA